VPVVVAAQDPRPAAPRARPSNQEIAAWVLLGALIIFVIVQHLVGAAITGLTLYLILDRTSERISKRLSGSAARTA